LASKDNPSIGYEIIIANRIGDSTNPVIRTLLCNGLQFLKVFIKIIHLRIIIHTFSNEVFITQA